jgi:phage terminase large subunit-like protein
MTPEQELAFLLEQEDRERTYNKLAYMYPETGPYRRELYRRHMEFFEATADHRECGFLGGNGVGKTWGVSAYVAALHLTGRYPKWWPGRRFDNPINAWAAGETREKTRDVVQAKLLGHVAKLGLNALGTGMIPRDCLGKPTFVQNTNYSCDFVKVRHVSGGDSVLGFKAYKQGRKEFDGEEKELILLDEEAPGAIYEECLMRGRTVDGQIITTFTPLQGMTPLVADYLSADAQRAKGRSMVRVICSMDDVPHLTESEKEELLAGVKPWQRQARRDGYPSVGTGLVYPVDEAQFVIKPIAIPSHWRRVVGFDHGYHNTAAVWLAYDKDADVVYIYADYKRGGDGITKEMHAQSLKGQGDWLPVVGDCAARDSDMGPVVLQYRALGVRMQKANKGAGSVDAGIQDILSRLNDGKLKVFSTCQKWLDEFRTYAYDEKQKIKKVNDHLMDATRYGVVDGLSVAAVERASANYVYAEATF